MLPLKFFLVCSAFGSDFSFDLVFGVCFLVLLCVCVCVCVCMGACVGVCVHCVCTCVCAYVCMCDYPCYTMTPEISLRLNPAQANKPKVVDLNVNCSNPFYKSHKRSCVPENLAHSQTKQCCRGFCITQDHWIKFRCEKRCFK